MRLIKRLSLALKMSIAAAMLIIFAMISIATLTISYQKESLRQNTFESNIAMTRNLAHDAVDPLLVFDPLRLDELVKTLLDATSCTYAMIIDKEGTIVAHTKRSLIGTKLSRHDTPELMQHLSEGRGFVREYIHEHESVKEFSHPIRIGNEVLGLATVAYSLKTINAVIESSLKGLKKYIYMITGILLIAGISGAFIISNLLTKPLKRLKDKMLDIQDGNLDVEVENPKIVECRERLDCEKSDCPAYGRLRCWSIAGTMCHGSVQGIFAQKIGDCRKCAVYKESCGDEIEELVEVFNQMVKDLRHNLNELEKVNAEKAKMERLSALGEMATTVAHEIKNPLNSIKIAVSYLKRNFQGELLTEFLTIIQEEVMRLNDITSNFLGFSKPAPLNPKICNINGIVKTTVELIRQEATDRNIEIVIFTDENLPLISCDLSRVKQALLNLLVNAMDASIDGDTITITTEAEASYIGISVQDTGQGIKSDDIEKIFKPFYSTKTRGSGLGLAIVDRIVKEHGGEIQVDSAINKGTTFTLKFKAEHEYAEA